MKLIPKTKLGKVFLAVVIVVFLAFLASLALDSYRQYKGEKRVEELANELKRLADLDLQKKTADKIGGKTPQETLEMFISAVEKGDYELASRYFVIERQAEELRSLQISKKENIDNVMGMLKEVDFIKGSYSEDKKQFVVRLPILVSFIFYPSSNWKIEEI